MKFTKTVIATLAIGASVAAHADGIEWSGFGSLYYSQAFDNKMLVAGDNNKPDFTSSSLLGFNAGSKISDDFAVATQIVMAGEGAQATNFNMFAQWAYATYKATDSLSFKIGRQLWPAQISSEYQRVHYLLPQASIPNTAYSLLPFVGFDGLSVSKNLDVGIGTLTVAAYLGNPKLNTTPPPAINMDFQTLMGVRATLDGSGWRLHATANKVFTKLTIDTTAYTGTTGVALDRITGKASEHSDIMSFGYRYDKHNFVSWGEMSYNKGSDKSNLALTMNGPTTGNTNVVISTKRMFEKSYGGYLLAGYRFGKFLPTVTVAQGTTMLGMPSSTTNGVTTNYDGKVTSYILGGSYQMNDQASFKAEFMRSSVPSVNGGFYAVTQSSASTKKYGDAVKAGVDFIF